MIERNRCFAIIPEPATQLVSCVINHNFKMASSSDDSKSIVAKLTKSEKKACRKQARKLHSLVRHDANLAKVSDSPTPHLMVGNGGLMCGVQRTHVLRLFQAFGHVERIVMLPRRSYAFVSFRSSEEARNAMCRVHGRVLDSPLEFPRPGVTLYLSYMASAPSESDVTGPGFNKPPGLLLVEDFVDEGEEERLAKVLGWSGEEVTTDTGEGWSTVTCSFYSLSLGHIQYWGLVWMQRRLYSPSPNLF